MLVGRTSQTGRADPTGTLSAGGSFRAHGMAGEVEVESGKTGRERQKSSQRSKKSRTMRSAAFFPKAQQEFVLPI